MTKFIVSRTLRLAAWILSWILYIATLMAAYGGYMNPEYWTLPSIGVLFFPYLAILTLIVGALWLISRKYFIGGAGILVLMACGPTFAEAVPFRFGHPPSNPERTFKMITFNSLHLSDQKNEDAPFSRSIHFLIHSGADFICLQELYSFGPSEIPERYGKQVDSLLKIYPYYSKDINREIEFLSKYPFRQQSLDIEDEIRFGNCAAYKLQIDGQPLTVINVHLPSYLLSENERKIITEAHSKAGMKKSLREFEGSVYTKMKNAFILRAKVSERVAEYAESVEGNVIVCGDFNDVPGSWSYRNFTKRGFSDAYAETGFGHIITYNQHLMLFHIDQILFKGNLLPLYVKKERINASDHYPLVAEFEFL